MQGCENASIRWAFRKELKRVQKIIYSLWKALNSNIYLPHCASSLQTSSITLSKFPVANNAL